MAAVPVVGGDKNVWGTKLNNFLAVAHEISGDNGGKARSTDTLFSPLFGTIQSTVQDRLRKFIYISDFTGNSLNTAISTIGASKATLYIDVASTYTGPLTIPSNINLVIPIEGSISGTGILTIAAPTNIGLYQVFSGAGTITFTGASIAMVFPQWWGATGDGITNDAPAIQTAINSIPQAASQAEMGKGGILRLTKGIYLCNTGIINNNRKISIIGDSMDNTTLKKGANDIDLLNVDSFVRYQTIRDLTLDGNNKTGLSLLYLNTPNYMLLAELNIINSDSTMSALHLQGATVTTMRNIQLTNNKKSAYFYNVNAGTIYNLNVAGKIGSLANDLEFVDAAQFSIFGLSLSDDTAMLLNKCTNFNIFGLYVETPLTNPAITIGVGGAPSKGVNITSVNVTIIPGVNTGPLIRAHLSSIGIAIKDVFIIQTQIITPHYTGGWIELGEVFGVSIDNVLIQSLTAGEVSGAKLIFSSNVGPDNVSINNVQAYSAPASTIEMTIANNLRITNCNVPITIGSASTDVVLHNCTGAITDEGNKATILDKQLAFDIGTLANSATPSVAGRSHWITGGTTTITDFTSGKIGQTITILAEHTITITDGTNIFLNGSVNFNMVTTDSLTLIKKADGKWYEKARSAN
ncbi:MAG: glycoside hydrolase family 55 protein [Candidatus Kuenenia sp.]|nr:glycoside hydrolase family 55 protein [Candidatus Kuenenia sp.]